MRITAKQVTTIVVSTVIMLMLFAIFVLFYNSQQNDLTYLVDDANICEWQDGVIVSSTEVASSVRSVSVDPADEASYLTEAAANGTCTGKQGSQQGAFDTQINAQFENQQ